MASFKKGKKRSFKKRSHPKKRWSKKFSGTKTKFLKSNIATSKETLNFATITPAASSGAQAQFITTQMSAFPRTQSISQNYRFYRLKKVTMELTFPYNTFQESTAGSPTVPYILKVMCRDGNYDGNTANAAASYAEMLALGAKPIKGQGVKKISWVPNIAFGAPMLDSTGGVLSSQTAVTTPVPAAAFNASYIQIKKSPWLSTYTLSTLPTTASASADIPPGQGADAVHFGLLLMIVQEVGMMSAVPVAVTLTLETEFKKPLDAVGGS
jgi:hypothetical protein